MKSKLHDFFVGLKPYKRLWKIFWLCFTIIAMTIFQLIMYVFASFVPHHGSAFTYWFKGLHSLFDAIMSETHAAAGFIAAGAILGAIPSIVLIIPLYFIFSNYIIQEVISEKFIEVPAENYRRWAYISHFGGLGLITMLITGIIGTSFSGVMPWPHTLIMGMKDPFSDNFGDRVCGIAIILYYGVGMVFLTITLLWLLGLALKWLFAQIAKLIEKYKAYLAIKREEKRARKLERLEAKRQQQE